ncbi:MAG: sodium-dependent transporter [Treponemataceae bacterium]|nr:MAG: sodium-dependent transporter [Treponemataceae bacterium]
MKKPIIGTKIRDLFSSRWGFILACVGSAVGMGNIWLFPYRVGQFGGAAFLIPYFVCVALLGFTGVMGEMAFGRSAQTGPIGAFRKAVESRGKNGKIGEAIALIPTFGSLGIAIGYSVVVGWILRFLVGSISGSAYDAPESGAYFGQIASAFGSVQWHLLGLAITFFIMIAGISAGIEKVNKIMIPAFFVLFLVLAIRAAFLPGAGAGYKYLFIPQWEYLFKIKTWVYALGQAFFSLSLAGSGTLVYGSYLSKQENVVVSARNVAIFDTLAAMLAALVIIPSVFAFGFDPAAGPPLMFITMPEVFKSMPFGQLFMVIFFVAVLFAAFTSLVNLFETPIEALQQKFGFSRTKAVLSIAAVAVIVGVCIEGIVGEWMDVVSIYIIPLGALLAAIMFYWIYGAKFAREQIQTGCTKPIGKWLDPLSRYIFCGITIAVYLLGIFYGGIG